MNAEEAKKLTEKSLQGSAIGSFVEDLDRKIKTAAEQGKSSIDPHLSISALRRKSPTNEIWEAIRKHYESKEFNWKAHPDPDPGHPGSRPYVVLSW